ncbi:MAG TPA: hypothetical protein VEU47_16855 [Candidatus Cybelea sp.]|nr:hypothetical protein [Candidatus Cybelea sp.]
MGSLLADLYGAFDPTLVYGCMLFGLAIPRLHMAIAWSLVWSIPVETIDFFTQASEPPPLLDSWLFDTAVEIGIGLAGTLLVWLVKRAAIAVMSRGA